LTFVFPAEHASGNRPASVAGKGGKQREEEKEGKRRKMEGVRLMASTVGSLRSSSLGGGKGEKKKGKGRGRWKERICVFHSRRSVPSRGKKKRGEKKGGGGRGKKRKKR